MARRPNYRFERGERDRAKAAKRAAKREAKAARKLEKNEGGAEVDPTDPDASPSGVPDLDAPED